MADVLTGMLAYYYINKQFKEFKEQSVLSDPTFSVNELKSQT